MSKHPLRLFYLLAALPVIAVTLAWARSYLPHDFFVFSNDGQLVLVFADGHRSSAFQDGPERSINLDAQLANARLISRFTSSFLGFELLSGPTPPVPATVGRFGSAYRSGEYRILSISYAWLFVLAAFLSAGAIYLLRRSAIRSRDNLCKSCGYDLRASTDRCPECGAPVPIHAPAA